MCEGLGVCSPVQRGARAALWENNQSRHGSVALYGHMLEKYTDSAATAGSHY